MQSTIFMPIPCGLLAVAAPTESLTIENVVGSTAINQEIDLKELLRNLLESEYDPDSFPGLLYRHEDPDATCMVFRSGKIVCTGASSIVDTERVVHNFLQKLHDMGLSVPVEPDPTIQNIVSTGAIREKLNLNAIAVGLGLEHIEYEPEQFPGLVYRMSEPDVVLLLFGSGKMVITGGQKPTDAEQALENIYSELSDVGLL